MKRRALCLGALAGAGLLLAGCATPVAPHAAGEPTAWSGRLALRLESDPVQSFSALFELQGSAEAGKLVLTTPIGNTLAQLLWSPGEALLMDGRSTRRFASVDALIEAATGAAIPVGALFAWLAGREQSVDGWRPDLSQVKAGRLAAVRESPAPRADLRIVFERA